MGKTTSKPQTLQSDGQLTTTNNIQIELVRDIGDDTNQVTILLIVIISIMIANFIYKLYKNHIKKLREVEREKIRNNLVV